MHEAAALSHPFLAPALIVAALVGSALVMPTRLFPRRTLVGAALILGAGIAAATAVAFLAGHGFVTRTDSLAHASLATTLLVLFATTPAMGRCGSSAGVIGGAVIMALAMIVSEAI